MDQNSLFKAFDPRLLFTLWFAIWNGLCVWYLSLMFWCIFMPAIFFPNQKILWENMSGFGWVGHHVIQQGKGAVWDGCLPCSDNFIYSFILPSNIYISFSHLWVCINKREMTHWMFGHDDSQDHLLFPSCHNLGKEDNICSSRKKRKLKRG